MLKASILAPHSVPFFINNMRKNTGQILNFFITSPLSTRRRKYLPLKFNSGLANWSEILPTFYCRSECPFFISWRIIVKISSTLLRCCSFRDKCNHFLDISFKAKIKWESEKLEINYVFLTNDTPVFWRVQVLPPCLLLLSLSSLVVGCFLRIA